MGWSSGFWELLGFDEGDCEGEEWWWLGLGFWCGSCGDVGGEEEGVAIDDSGLGRGEREREMYRINRVWWRAWEVAVDMGGGRWLGSGGGGFWGKRKWWTNFTNSQAHA